MDLTLNETTTLIQRLGGVRRGDHELRRGIGKLATHASALADEALEDSADAELTRVRNALVEIEACARSGRTQELVVARGELDRALGKKN